MRKKSKFQRDTRLKEYSPLLSFGRNVTKFKQLALRTYLPKAVSGSTLKGEKGQSYMLILEVFLWLITGGLYKKLNSLKMGLSNLKLGCRVDVKCSHFLGLPIFGVSLLIIKYFGKKQTQVGNLGWVYLPLAFLDSW